MGDGRRATGDEQRQPALLALVVMSDGVVVCALIALPSSSASDGPKSQWKRKELSSPSVAAAVVSESAKEGRSNERPECPRSEESFTRQGRAALCLRVGAFLSKAGRRRPLWKRTTTTTTTRREGGRGGEREGEVSEWLAQDDGASFFPSFFHKTPHHFPFLLLRLLFCCCCCMLLLLLLLLPNSPF